jgi:hypothetical protein
VLFLGHVMAVVPEPHRAPAQVLPWLPLPAILGFSLLGLGGSIALTFTTFSYAEAERWATPSNKARVYEARAVPFDSQRENPAGRAEAISRALTATQVEVRHVETGESGRPSEISQPLLLADSNRELRGFHGFGNVDGGNSYLSVSGTSFGISAQSAPSGFAAPDAETQINSAVPEASTWMCGAALLLLVGVRGMRARVHRNRRRDWSR